MDKKTTNADGFSSFTLEYEPFELDSNTGQFHPDAVDKCLRKALNPNGFGLHVHRISIHGGKDFFVDIGTERKLWFFHSVPVKLLDIADFSEAYFYLEYDSIGPRWKDINLRFEGIGGHVGNIGISLHGVLCPRPDIDSQGYFDIKYLSSRSARETGHKFTRRSGPELAFAAFGSVDFKAEMLHLESGERENIEGGPDGAWVTPAKQLTTAKGNDIKVNILSETSETENYYIGILWGAEKKPKSKPRKLVHADKGNGESIEVGKHTTFVLGAGFSASFGLPLQSELFDSISPDRHRSVMKRYYGRRAIEDLEFFLTLEDARGLFTEQPGTFRTGMSRAKEICTNILCCQAEFTTKGPNPLLELLFTKAENVVSFNWDIILEQYLSLQRGATISGPFIDSKTPIAKLHGSIDIYYQSKGKKNENWEKLASNPEIARYRFFYEASDAINTCALEQTTPEKRAPYMITPTFLKYFRDIYIQEIRQKAFMWLKEADNLVFIGYSLPESDYLARCLFVEATKLKKPHILVVNSDRQGTAKPRYRELFEGYPIKFIKDRCNSDEAIAKVVKCLEIPMEFYADGEAIASEY